MIGVCGLAFQEMSLTEAADPVVCLLSIHVLPTSIREC